MKEHIISGGIDSVHKLPKDLKSAISSSDDVYKLWENITPLARNEFICWVENAKLIETRARRVRRTTEELQEGNRRPCCWPGCMHRTDKELNKTQKWIARGKK